MGKKLLEMEIVAVELPDNSEKLAEISRRIKCSEKLYYEYRRKIMKSGGISNPSGNVDIFRELVNQDFRLKQVITAEVDKILTILGELGSLSQPLFDIKD